MTASTQSRFTSILRDQDQNQLELLFCYNYRGGASLYQDYFIRVAFPYCEQNVWLRDETFRIRDYFPQAVLIERIMLAARGWDYEGCVDNVALRHVFPRETAVPFYAEALYINITQPQQGSVYSPCAPDMVTWDSNIPAEQGSPSDLDLYWRECGALWQWFAADNNDGAHPWSSAPCDPGCYEVKIVYDPDPAVCDTVTFEVEGGNPPPPDRSGLGFFVDFSGSAQTHDDVENRIDPWSGMFFYAYFGLVRLGVVDDGADGLTMVSFAASIQLETVIPLNFENLLPGDLSIGSWDEGITLVSTECISLSYGEVVYLGRLGLLYVMGSGDVLVVDHPEYPRWVVDCEEPEGGLYSYCVWTHGGIAKDALDGDYNCEPYTAVEQKSWGSIKAMYR